MKATIVYQYEDSVDAIIVEGCEKDIDRSIREIENMIGYCVSLVDKA